MVWIWFIEIICYFLVRPKITQKHTSDLNYVKLKMTNKKQTKKTYFRVEFLKTTTTREFIIIALAWNLFFNRIINNILAIVTKKILY